MTRSIHLVIPGKPLGKQRAKGANQGGHVRMYTPEQTVSYETLIRLEFMRKYPNWVPWGKGIPLKSSIYSFYPISKMVEMRMKKGVRCYPTVKPDLDNVEKISWDGLNQIAFADDCQIVEAHEFKYYSDRPRVEIMIEEYVDDWSEILC